jgi:hypothetical protein
MKTLSVTLIVLACLVVHVSTQASNRSATILNTDTSWTADGAPSIDGGEYVITDSVSAVTKKLYRLHKP